MKPEPNQEANYFREPRLVMAFQVIGTLSLIAGLVLSLALTDPKDFPLGLLGISAIVNAVIMFGFAAVIRSLAEIAWHSRKAHEQREALLSVARG
jgi:hypothetical protein